EADDAVGRTINAGSGHAVTIGDLATLAMEVIGREVPVVCDPDRVRPEKSEVLALICDNSAAKDILGWAPTVSLRDGLARCAEFVESHLDLFKPGEYAV
ncbi:MAG: NAD-dependent dehydratase, partial [Planctomycetota bacterium]